jgi:hypothetical protein
MKVRQILCKYPEVYEEVARALEAETKLGGKIYPQPAATENRPIESAPTPKVSGDQV